MQICFNYEEKIKEKKNYDIDEVVNTYFNMMLDGSKKRIFQYL